MREQTEEGVISPYGRFNILEALNGQDFFHLRLEFWEFFLISPTNLGAGLPNFTHGVFNQS